MINLDSVRRTIVRHTIGLKHSASSQKVLSLGDHERAYPKGANLELLTLR